MKKLICIALCVVMVMGLCGCDRGYDDFAKESPFSLVDRGKNYAICKHDETGVYYIIYEPELSYGAGISVMLNPDGTPYTG